MWAGFLLLWLRRQNIFPCGSQYQMSTVGFSTCAPARAAWYFKGLIVLEFLIFWSAVQDVAGWC